MKPLFILLLIPLLFFACTSSPKQREDSSSYFEPNGKLKVLSTVAMIDDLVGEIGGEEVDHLSLIVGNLNPHLYEMVKGDGEKLECADLIFCNGLGLEHGASLRYYLKQSSAVYLGDWVLAKKPHLFFSINGQIDPHIWMDITLFAEVIDPIVESLSEKIPKYKERFAKRGRALKEKMWAKDQVLYEKMQKLPSSARYLVTSHDAFNYFTRRYLADPGEQEWTKRTAAPEGLAPDGQMSVLDIQNVCDFLCKHQVRVIFPETNLSRHSLKKIIAICREKGVLIHISPIPLYGDTMGGEGTQAQTYLQMIEHNITTLSTFLMESHEEKTQRS